jgi:hypothetical protein
MTPSTNSTSNSSGWTAMPSKRDLLLLNGLALGVILLILLGGCGLLTGNPEDQLGANRAPSGTEFLDPTSDYLGAGAAGASAGTNCGYFTGQSPPAEVETGRDCIRNAFTTCQAAFYLFDETKSDGTRFASFVTVLSSCGLTVHAVSTDPTRFIGEDTKTCSEISEPIEMACGIGS